MANRYANLVGSNKIKDEYSKINTGFDAVQAEMDAVNAELDAHKADTIAHVTQAEHDKLAGIEPGAQVNQNAFSRINDVSATTEEDTVTFQGGTGIIITTDPATKRVIWTATGEATPGPHASSHITGGTDVIPDAVPNGSSGLMSGADKAKLDALPNDVQTQLDNIRADIGDKSQLQTSDKSNLVAAVNELFTSVGSGKEMLAAAITDKGVPTSPTDTFATMAANIGAIETGGPWFGDWGAYTPVYNISGSTQNVPAKSWHTFVDVSGVGFFKWCRGFNATAYPTKIRITIDGVEKIFDFTGELGYVGNEVNVEIPFFESLKIEVYNSSSSASGIGCDYLYFLRNTSPDPNVSTILQQSVLASVLSNVTSSSLVDVANLTGSGYLLGIRSWGYGTGGGDVYLDVDIDGSKKMNDRRVWSISIGPYKFDRIIGPIRFNSSLRVRTRGTGGTQLIIVDYSLD